MSVKKHVEMGRSLALSNAISEVIKAHGGLKDAHMTAEEDMVGTAETIHRCHALKFVETMKSRQVRIVTSEIVRLLPRNTKQ